MKNITTLVYKGRTFEIVKKDGFYLAVEDKYLTDGIMNTTLNGLQMNASEELGRCINQTKNAVELDEYMEQGFTREEAVCKVLGFPIEMAEVLVLR